MKDLAGLAVTREQFFLLADCCRADPKFPGTWESWSALLAGANREAMADGMTHNPVALDPGNFRTWCARMGIVPCVDALRAYAIVLRSPRASMHYGAVELDARDPDDWPPPPQVARTA